jgi:iron complex transport system ATP-binding protein
MENVSEIVLQAAAISIGYRQKDKNIPVADNVSLVLEKGKLIGLIGENGIGKSTLLRTVTGIQNPLQGDVLLLGKAVNKYSNLEMAQKVSVVLTEKLPPSNLSVYELVALGRQPYTNWVGKLTTIDVQKIEEAIALTQIEHLRHKKHYELSDGQLQYVMIARALAQDTPLIVLDEPTTHLDLLHKVALFKLLKELTLETQKCILYSTHDIDLAIQLSDELLIMMDNEVLQNTPFYFMENKTFSKLFKDDSIHFDAEKGRFVVL